MEPRTDEELAILPNLSMVIRYGHFPCFDANIATGEELADTCDLPVSIGLSSTNEAILQKSHDTTGFLTQFSDIKPDDVNEHRIDNTNSHGDGLVSSTANNDVISSNPFEDYIDKTDSINLYDVQPKSLRIPANLDPTDESRALIREEKDHTNPFEDYIDKTDSTNLYEVQPKSLRITANLDPKDESRVLIREEKDHTNPFEDYIDKTDSTNLYEVQPKSLRITANLDPKDESRVLIREEKDHTNPFEDYIDKTDNTGLCEVHLESVTKTLNHDSNEESLQVDEDKNIKSHYNSFDADEKGIKSYLCEDSKRPVTSTPNKDEISTEVSANDVHKSDLSAIQSSATTIQQKSQTFTDVADRQEVSRAHVKEVFLEAFKVSYTELRQIEETLRNKDDLKVTLRLEDMRAEGLPLPLNKVHAPSTEITPLLFLRVKLGEENHFLSFSSNSTVATIQQSLVLNVQNMYNDTLLLEVWHADKMTEDANKLDFLGRLKTGSVRRKKEANKNIKTANTLFESNEDEPKAEKTESDEFQRTTREIHDPLNMSEQSHSISSDPRIDKPVLTFNVTQSPETTSSATALELSIDTSVFSKKGTASHPTAPSSNTEELTVTEKSINLTRKLRNSFKIKSIQNTSKKVFSKFLNKPEILPSSSSIVPEESFEEQTEKREASSHECTDESTTDSHLSIISSREEQESLGITQDSTFSLKSIGKSIRRNHHYVAKDLDSSVSTTGSLVQSGSCDTSLVENSHENTSDNLVTSICKIREPDNPPDVQAYLSSMGKDLLQAEMLAHTIIEVKDFVGTWAQEKWFPMKIECRRLVEVSKAKRKHKSSKPREKLQKIQNGDEIDKICRMHVHISLPKPECEPHSLDCAAYTTIYSKLFDMTLNAKTDNAFYEDSMGAVGDILLEQIDFFFRISEGYQKLTKWLVISEKKSSDSVFIYPLLEELKNRLIAGDFTESQKEIFAESISKWTQQVLLVEFENLHSAFPNSEIVRLENFLRCFKTVSDGELEKHLVRDATRISLSSLRDQLKAALTKHAETWIKALKKEAESKYNEVEEEKKARNEDSEPKRTDEQQIEIKREEKDRVKRDVHSGEKVSEDRDINPEKDRANAGNGFQNRGSSLRKSVLRYRPAFLTTEQSFSSFLEGVSARILSDEIRGSSSTISETMVKAHNKKRSFRRSNQAIEKTKEDMAEKTWNHDLKKAEKTGNHDLNKAEKTGNHDLNMAEKTWNHDLKKAEKTGNHDLKEAEKKWNHNLKMAASLTKAITDFVYISATLYQPIFIIEMSVNYLQWIMPKFFETAVHVLGTTQHLEVAVANSMTNDDVSSAVQAAWKICSNLNELNKVSVDIKLPADQIPPKYTEAFSESVIHWLTLGKILSMKNSESDIQRDQLQAVDSDKGYSHYSVSMANVLKVIMAKLKKMWWPGGVRPEAHTLAQIIQHLITFTKEYKTRLVQICTANEGICKTGVISTQVCVAVRDVEYVCDQSEEHIKLLASWASQESQREGLPVDENVKTFEQECMKQMDGLKVLIIEAAKELLKKCLPDLEVRLEQSWRSGSTDTVIKTLEEYLQPIEDRLYFANPILIALWQKINKHIHRIKEKYSKVRGWEDMKNLLKILTASYTFLTDSQGVGCHLPNNDIQEYEKLKEDLMLLGTSTSSLIAQYYNERYEEKSATESMTNEHIVTNVTFGEEGLRVNIIQAPGNQNGVLVKVRLEPEEWFSNVLPKKTSQTSDEPAVFDEVLQFSNVGRDSIKDRENNEHCGAVVFQIRTPRTLLRSIVNHEAIMPLDKISTVDKSELSSIQHTRLALTRPRRFSDYNSLEILRNRPQDKSTKKFLSLLQSRWPDNIELVSNMPNLNLHRFSSMKRH